MKNRVFLILLFLTNSIAFSQKSDVFSSQGTKYQIGIGATKFINSVFPSDKNSFLVEARFKGNERIHYRLGLDYDLDNSKDGSYKGGIKFGVDKLFRNSGNWFFYYGVDLGYRHDYLKDVKKHNGSIFVSPLLGILYKFSKNFSISTEPNIFIKTNFLIDNDTFEKDNKTIWTESSFGKIGFLQLNFHF